MYRIAIIDDDSNARGQAHLLAAKYFTERRESAAFAICEGKENLPKEYDCYLQGDAERMSLLRTMDEMPPWAGVKKPLKRETFFELLERWEKQHKAELTAGSEECVDR